MRRLIAVPLSILAAQGGWSEAGSTRGSRALDLPGVVAAIRDRHPGRRGQAGDVLVKRLFAIPNRQAGCHKDLRRPTAHLEQLGDGKPLQNGIVHPLDVADDQPDGGITGSSATRGKYYSDEGGI